MHYLGTFSHSLDAKGRLFIPARFRDQIGDEVVVMMSPDKCLFVYDNDEFAKIVEQVKTSAVDKPSRDKARTFYRSTATLPFDKQGRVTLPQSFIKYAGLSSDVVILGAANRLEIWPAGAPEAAEPDADMVSDENFPEIIY